MVAKSTEQLERMLMVQLKKAMNIAAKEILADMYEETGDFYSQGDPKEYIRTGALGDTPRTTPLTISGNMISFKAYLDQTHNYTTGTWNMPEVLDAAEKGLGGILGKPEFWKRSLEKMEKTFNRVMRDFFK